MTPSIMRLHKQDTYVIRINIRKEQKLKHLKNMV